MHKKLNFIVFPYRNNYFKFKFGISVRDLQIIEIIKSNRHVANLAIVDRPLSIYEQLLGKGIIEENYLRINSRDYFGPLKGRSWTEYCYDEAITPVNNLTKEWENIVLLDFTPIAKIATSKLKHDIYWYDLIDNFSKHNRYSENEKLLTLEKYSIVDKNAQIITGVTDQALRSFRNKNKKTISNGLYPHYGSSHAQFKTKHRYKYGFIGFITDKFDIDFINKLSCQDSDFGLIIWGKCLDKSIKKNLSHLDNVRFQSEFTRTQIPGIMSSFKVGLIPYLQEKSHDGSPLKLYEYLHFNKPIVSSINYEINNDYIINYNETSYKNIIQWVNEKLCMEDNIISQSLHEDDYLESKINGIIKLIQDKI